MNASASAEFWHRRRETDDGFAQHAAHAGFFRRFGHHILEVVHVGESGGAGEHHFEAAEARSPAHEIGRHVLRFGREDVVAPASPEAEIVGDAAEQRHGGVRVGVDQAGSQDGIGPVEPLAGLVAPLDFGCRCRRPRCARRESRSRRSR